jgi:hypothetical protein
MVGIPRSGDERSPHSVMHAPKKLIRRNALAFREVGRGKRPERIEGSDSFPKAPMLLDDGFCVIYTSVHILVALWESSP